MAELIRLIKAFGVCLFENIVLAWISSTSLLMLKWDQYETRSEKVILLKMLWKRKTIIIITIIIISDFLLLADCVLQHNILISWDQGLPLLMGIQCFGVTPESVAINCEDWFLFFAFYYAPHVRNSQSHCHRTGAFHTHNLKAVVCLVSPAIFSGLSNSKGTLAKA